MFWGYYPTRAYIYIYVYRYRGKFSAFESLFLGLPLCLLRLQKLVRDMVLEILKAGHDPCQSWHLHMCLFRFVCGAHRTTSSYAGHQIEKKGKKGRVVLSVMLHHLNGMSPMETYLRIQCTFGTGSAG